MANEQATYIEISGHLHLLCDVGREGGAFLILVLLLISDYMAIN